jgi:hypothetical protein
MAPQTRPRKKETDESDPALLAHVRSLGLDTVEEYVAWCVRHGFSRRTTKTAPQRAKEHSFATRAAADARLALLDRRRAGLDERLAEDRETTPRRGDRYLRSLAEHRTESTAREVAWLDELIAAERRAVQPEPSQEGATAS